MRCYARYLFLAVVALLGLGQMLTACGQKGPLYHPDQTQDEAPPALPQDSVENLPAQR